MFTFPIVSMEQNIFQSQIVFEILNIREILRKTSVGEFIKSESFELYFPTSIGKSKWDVILFLNGQYNNGNPDRRVALYLKMIYCEKPSMVLKLDVAFQLNHVKNRKLNEMVCFNDLNRRWIGPQFFNLNEVINATLLLSIHMEVNLQVVEHGNSFHEVYT